MIITISPLDKVFFGENRPFNQADLGSGQIKSYYPPTSQTIIGMVRARLARHLGWDGRSDWDDNIIRKLGDQEDLGPLSLQGPYLYNECNKQFLFPTPPLLFGSDVYKTRLIPTDERYVSSLSATSEQSFRLLVPDHKVLPESDGIIHKLLGGGTYVTGDDLRRILDNTELDKIKFIDPQGDNLWKSEMKVGINLDPKTKTTTENSLFARSFVTPNPNFELICELEGYDKEDIPDAGLQFLGGEGRIGHLAFEKQTPIQLPDVSFNDNDNTLQFIASCITPTLLPNQPDELVTQLETTFNASFITACVGKKINIGGWNGVKHQPTTLQSYYPAGSTFFFECSIKESKRIEAFNGTQIGSSQEYGYGQILIGKW